MEWIGIVTNYYNNNGPGLLLICKKWDKNITDTNGLVDNTFLQTVIFFKGGSFFNFLL